LNKDGMQGPAGKTWGPSTIYGNWQRGTGILNNELYVGRLVWNRQQFIKDPNTGRRQARLNPEAKWIIEEVPHLRIIDDHLWSRVKERQRNE
jgi:site-specific DNA recombinase